MKKKIISMTAALCATTSVIHGNDVIEVVPPTQTSEGYSVYQCYMCGHTWYDDFTAPLS